MNRDNTTNHDKYHKNNHEKDYERYHTTNNDKYHKRYNDKNRYNINSKYNQKKPYYISKYYKPKDKFDCINQIIACNCINDFDYRFNHVLLNTFEESIAKYRKLYHDNYDRVFRELKIFFAKKN